MPSFLACAIIPPTMFLSGKVLLLYRFSFGSPCLSEAAAFSLEISLEYCSFLSRQSRPNNFFPLACCAKTGNFRRIARFFTASVSSPRQMLTYPAWTRLIRASTITSFVSGSINNWFSSSSVVFSIWQMKGEATASRSEEQDVSPSEQMILKSLTFSLRNGGHNGAMSCQLKSNEDECKSQSVEKWNITETKHSNRVTIESS